MRIGPALARLSLKPKPTKGCERCSLRFPQEDAECPYCYGLSDGELQQVKQQIKSQHDARAKLGRIFLAITVIIVILLLLTY
ncbi:hypothetical protein [Glaciecola sp. 1036]|uniref:hypothetical protein n=1 Tax=Alteromonadaceae TaxID=72275 RepID=UPI003CFBDE11